MKYCDRTCSRLHKSCTGPMVVNFKGKGKCRFCGKALPTSLIRKFLPEHNVQQYTGAGWEDVAASDSRTEARRDLTAYRTNAAAQGPYRLIARRVINPAWSAFYNNPAR